MSLLDPFGFSSVCLNRCDPFHSQTELDNRGNAMHEMELKQELTTNLTGWMLAEREEQQPLVLTTLAFTTGTTYGTTAAINKIS